MATRKPAGEGAKAVKTAGKPVRSSTKAKAAPASAPEPKKAAKASDAAATLRLKDFVDRVAAAAGAKKNAAKPLVEATLRLLGETLEAGETLVLPPLGRLKVSRSRDTAKGAALTVKIKRIRGGGAAADPLADDGEAG